VQRGRAQPLRPRKAERGDPAVSLTVYATLLFNFGMIHRLANILEAPFDRAGLTLQDQQLPRRGLSRDPPAARPAGSG
jgi:hypothetical protein